MHIKTIAIFTLMLSANIAFAQHSCELIKITNSANVIEKNTIDHALKELRVIRHSSFNELSFFDEQNLMSNFLHQVCKIPVSHLETTKQKGIKFFLTNGSITAHPRMKKLYESNEMPRNHESSTWEKLPGAYEPMSKNVIINIASLDSGHGSKNLVLHEYAHALDYVYSSSFFGKKKLSSTSSFKESVSNTPWRKIYQNEDYKDLDAIPEEHNVSEESRKTWTDYAIRYNETIDMSSDMLTEYADKNSEEHFAELYSMYYESTKSKSKLERLMPEVSNYFSSLGKTVSSESRGKKRLDQLKRFFNKVKNEVEEIID